MEIIIYTNIGNTQKDTLLKKFSKISNLTPVMVFDFKSLFHLLQSKISGQVIIVFLISSDKELEYLDSNRDYLSNTRYIIILPNNEKTMISKALSLYPRYLAHTNYEIKDVCAVLNKMIQYNARKENRILKAQKRK
ncbi:MAG: hypothetical protein L3J69_12435 [Desulfobacula sp.]|nr:hypothetical protein [Desulfobacula sp.]